MMNAMLTFEGILQQIIYRFDDSFFHKIKKCNLQLYFLRKIDAIFIKIKSTA
jgi:hypothetical protein